MKSILREYGFFKTGIQILKVQFNSIKYINSDHVYSMLNTDKGVVPLRTKLDLVGSYIPDNEFVRIHQRFIVNINHIDKIDNDSVFIGNIELPLGKKYKKSLLGKINLFK